jgi:hypothetical protein
MAKVLECFLEFGPNGVKCFNSFSPGGSERGVKKEEVDVEGGEDPIEQFQLLPSRVERNRLRSDLIRGGGRGQWTIIVGERRIKENGRRGKCHSLYTESDGQF